jgi:hypothetical protein
MRTWLKVFRSIVCEMKRKIYFISFDMSHFMLRISYLKPIAHIAK